MLPDSGEKTDGCKQNQGRARRNRYTYEQKAEVVLEYDQSVWPGSLKAYCNNGGLPKKFEKFPSESEDGG
jgi:hypothetical protein